MWRRCILKRYRPKTPHKDLASFRGSIAPIGLRFPSAGAHAKARVLLPIAALSCALMSMRQIPESESAHNECAEDNMYPAIEPYNTGYLSVSEGHQLYYEECGNPHGKVLAY